MPKGRSLHCVLFSVLLCLSAAFFALLLIRAVAGACHSTVGTVAAAGGFAFFLIFYEAEYYQRHDNDQKQQDNIVGLNGCQCIKVAHCFYFLIE